MKTKILVAALAAGMVASPAMAAVSVSGQVSNIVGIGGDFDESFNIAQNNSSGSRFRFKAEKEWGGIKVGLRHEIQNRKGPAGNNGEGPEDSGVASGQDDLRYSDIYFAGGFGKLSVGQGDGAANGLAESYTNVGGNYFGGLDSYWFGITSIQQGANLGFAQFDFLSRNQRIRYDSPKFGGAQLSASLRSQNGGELALRYKGGAGGWKWTGNAGFSTADNADGTSTERTVVTAGVLMPFGLNIAGRIGEQDIEGATRDTSLISVGYRIGKLRANVEFGSSDNADGTETDGTVVGVTYAGPVLIYAQVGKFERGAEEFSAPVVGFRMKF